MNKGFLRMLIAVGLMVGLGIPAEAAQSGQIRIQPHYAENTISGGTVTISHVGTASEEGYKITGKTGNWIIAADELFLPETVTWVRKHARGEQTTQKAESSGIFSFQDLDAGVYLVTQSQAQTGYAPFSPFLIELPVGGEVWEAEALPEVETIPSENPKTGDHPAPIIAAMAFVLSVSVLLVLSDQRSK